MAKVTPAWLEQRLPQLKEAGEVLAVDAEPLVTPFGAPLWRLLVTYAKTNPNAPTRLIFKCAQTGERGANEVEFYAYVAPRLPPGVVPACLDAAKSASGGAWHLVLADLGETHRPPVFPLPPTDGDCYRAMRALARLHATWWNDSRLGRGIGTRWDDQRVNQLCNDTEPVVRSFLAFLGDALSPRRRGIYDRLRMVQPALRHRQMARPLTVTHGDPHWGNCLFHAIRRSIRLRLSTGNCGGCSGCGGPGVPPRVVVVA